MRKKGNGRKIRKMEKLTCFLLTSEQKVKVKKEQKMRIAERETIGKHNRGKTREINTIVELFILKGKPREENENS